MSLITKINSIKTKLSKLNKDIQQSNISADRVIAGKVFMNSNKELDVGTFTANPDDIVEGGMIGITSGNMEVFGRWKPIINSGFYDKCYYSNNGIWIAIKSNIDDLAYSADGVSWFQAMPGLNLNLDKFCSDEATLALYGTDGLCYSIDGIAWEQSIINDTVNYCHCDLGVWVACSENNGLYYSTDGIVWEQSNITTNGFSSCYYGNNIWIACSNNNNGLYYSEDGIVWEQSNTATTGNFNSCYYSIEKGIWLINSDNYNLSNTIVDPDNREWCTYYSLDNFTTFEPIKDRDSNVANFSLDPSVFGYKNINNELIVRYANGLCYSTDGMEWSNDELPDSLIFIATSDTKSLIINGGILFHIDESNIYMYSETFFSVLDYTGEKVSAYPFKYCCYGNGVWVACYSEDGTEQCGLFYTNFK